jgi:hypothetical protein
MASSVCCLMRQLEIEESEENLWDDQIKENEIVRACSTRRPTPSSG